MDTIEAMVASADELMYQAKARGGDSVVGRVVIGLWTRWSDHVAEVDRQLERLDEAVFVSASRS